MAKPAKVADKRQTEDKRVEMENDIQSERLPEMFALTIGEGGPPWVGLRTGSRSAMIAAVPRAGG